MNSECPKNISFLYYVLLLLLLSHCSRVRFCATPQTAAHLAPPSLGFSRQEQVGCHFLLQCMKVKSESEVDQSCPTLSDPMDYSLPGSSIHGIFQARVLEWGAIALVPNRMDEKNTNSQTTPDQLNEKKWGCGLATCLNKAFPVTVIWSLRTTELVLLEVITLWKLHVSLMFKYVFQRKCPYLLSDSQKKKKKG